MHLHVCALMIYKQLIRQASFDAIHMGRDFVAPGGIKLVSGAHYFLHVSTSSRLIISQLSINHCPIRLGLIK